MSDLINLELTKDEAYMLTQLLRRNKHKDLKARIHAEINKAKSLKTEFRGVDK